MIIRKGETPKTAGKEGPSYSIRISEMGGLTQFGAHVDTLLPGQRSSDRHWHQCEDEFLFMLTGEATVIENDGEHLLSPGDSACWPAGVPNAHTIWNHSAEPCSYLICGTKLPRDVVQYPDLGRCLHIDGRKWYIRGADGVLINHGEESSEGGWIESFAAALGNGKQT